MNFEYGFYYNEYFIEEYKINLRISRRKHDYPSHLFFLFVSETGNLKAPNHGL